MAPELTWGERTYVMGIVNVTPDSFSGDGLAMPDRAIDEVVAARPNIVRRAPNEKELQGWIDQSKKLPKVVEH